MIHNHKSARPPGRLNAGQPRHLSFFCVFLQKRTTKRKGPPLGGGPSHYIPVSFAIKG
jgi:hypothetical protein